MHSGEVESDNYTLMLVECNPQRVGDVKLALEELDVSLEILAFDRGIDALEHLRGVHLDPASHARPDLVLLSLDSRGQVTLEVLQKIKGDPHWKALPVVVFSDSESAQEIQNVYQMQASAFVVKPKAVADLKQTLKAWAHFWLHTAELPKQV